MLFHFYDIESLSNVFMLADYKPEINELDIYHLVDSADAFDRRNPSDDDVIGEISYRIHLRNQNFNGKVNVFDLHDRGAVERLAYEIGVSDIRNGFSDPESTDSLHNKFRPVCDTDPDYDADLYPYLLGYNSYNYDTTMLAKYFELSLYNRDRSFTPIRAKTMRIFNDRLFTRFKKNMPLALEMNDACTKRNRKGTAYNIRKNMLLSGRHLDVARLNEKMSEVGLKRLLGMLGYQILESAKLSENTDHIDNFDELCELIAYNASDVINLKMLFDNDLYQAQFSLKRQLLLTYPQITFDQQVVDGVGNYLADIRPEKVREDRLTIDSSSAQFATKCLCPYGYLTDIETVSYMYPSEQKAKELGIKRVNVLEEAKKFFYRNIKNPNARRQFDAIYNYYKSLEGKNFNGSKNYPWSMAHPLQELSNFKAPMMCIPYFDANGNPTTCFATFSTGGLHGAEANMPLFKADYDVWKQKREDMDYVQSVYPDPVDLRKAKTIVMPDGRTAEYTEFLRSGLPIAKSEYRLLEKPQLFELKSNGKSALKKRYSFTSADWTNHEDFTSYYPNMLRMLSAFWNPGLGYDRYAEIFDQKQKYGKLMKDKSIPAEKRDFYKVMREGTKLILNSASGAADTTYGTQIQMNNLVLSMRIIGNLFSWRIGQAQALRGSKITSTNTDGLYSVMEETLNNKILAEESADIGVEIEPERLFLISKDSNNRLELSDDHTITSASGATVACRRGPTPQKAPNHPIIIDYALAEYLVKCATHQDGLDLSKPFDEKIGRSILEGAYDAFLKECKGDAKAAEQHWLMMFQNVLASSPSSNTYHFARHDGEDEIDILAHYNRVFIMRDGYESGVHLYAAATKKFTPDDPKKTRKKNPRFEPAHDETAMFVLHANGVMDKEVADRDCIVTKINNIDPDWYMLIMNKSIYELTEAEIEDLRHNINMDAYLSLLKSGFNKNWRNAVPGDQEDTDDDDGESDE